MTHPCIHLLSNDGERLFIGRAEGTVSLRDRHGAELRNVRMDHPISAVGWMAAPGMFIAGTWGGTLAGFVDQGRMWKRELSGVISAVATSAEGVLAAGTWTGEVKLLHRAQGNEIGGVNLHEAVVAMALCPRGDVLLVALADKTLLALDRGGAIRWRQTLAAPISKLGASLFEFLVVTEDGLIRRLRADGSEAARIGALGPFKRTAMSHDGTTVAWISAAGRLHMWQPEHEQPWDVHLEGAPQALAIAGAETDRFALVLLPGEVQLHDAFCTCSCQQLALPTTARDLCVSALGLEASVILDDGSPHTVDLEVARARLAPARVRPRISSGHFVVGRIGALVVELKNEGRREAHDVRVELVSEHIRPSTPETIATLIGGEARQIRPAFEPVKAGELPLLVCLSWRDDRGQTQREEFKDFISVTQGEHSA